MPLMSPLSNVISIDYFWRSVSRRKRRRALSIVFPARFTPRPVSFASAPALLCCAGHNISALIGNLTIGLKCAPIGWRSAYAGARATWRTLRAAYLSSRHARRRMTPVGAILAATRAMSWPAAHYLMYHGRPGAYAKVGLRRTPGAASHI